MRIRPISNFVGIWDMPFHFSVMVCVCIQVKSRKGYQGCLSSLEVVGEKKPLLEPGVSRIPPQYSESIRQGCIGQLQTFYEYILIDFVVV